MITSFAQFLEALKDKEATILSDEQVKHGPTIGEMYEGLTRELLERAIPAALNLRLLDGFVIGVDGRRSHQTDAMLVMGDAGRRIPKTEKWEWPIGDVLAVFEVKKNLYAADLADSLAKMKTISEQQKQYLFSENRQVNLAPSFKAFARALGRLPAADEMEDLENAGGEILRTIAHEQLAPLRVVFGYQGYADEYGLRTAFLDALGAVEDGMAGPALLPNLIVCRRNALIKLSGHPFISPLRDNGEWDLFGSTREAPFGLLLELLWTRLGNQFRAQFPFDDTLEVEAIAPLLTGKPANVDGRRGWYFYAKNVGKKPLADLKREQWSPFQVSQGEVVLYQMAMARGGLDISDPGLVEAAAAEGVDLVALADRLIGARLFVWRASGVAEPIADTIHQAVTPKGEWWLSSNLPLLNLWIAERAKQPS